MARAGLDKNRKFLRLARTLDCVGAGMGELIARGALETLWDSAYERADDYLGDTDDVEIAARWRGERGLLFDALLKAGGNTVGFIEPDPDRAGFRVHDLWEHAPPWVKRKATQAAARAEAGVTIADARSKAGKKGRALQLGQPVDPLPGVQATGGQTVGKLPSRDGTGRAGDGTGSPQKPPRSGGRTRSRSAAGAPPDPRALAVLAAVNEARTRVISGARALSPTPENLQHISDRLQHNTLEDCLHVVAVAAAGVEADPDSHNWFDAVTPFRPDNFARNVARTLGTEPASDYQPATGTPEEIAAQEQLELERGQRFLAGLRSTP